MLDRTKLIVVVSNRGCDTSQIAHDQSSYNRNIDIILRKYVCPDQILSTFMKFKLFEDLDFSSQ